MLLSQGQLAPPHLERAQHMRSDALSAMMDMMSAMDATQYSMRFPLISRCAAV